MTVTRESQPVSFDLAAEPSCAGQLVVQFTRQRDRFCHQLVCLCPDARDVVAQSVELDDPADWPTSPPIQQIDECVLNEGRRGLVGIGMAGTSHWSLAVEAVGGEIWFDVACRVQRPNAAVRSTYQRAEAKHLVGQIDLVSPADCVETESAVWLVRPSQIPSSLPATIRWRYGFALKTVGT